MEFLCSELKVVSTQEAEDRIFFVSAKEALHQRLTESGVTTTPSKFAEQGKEDNSVYLGSKR